MATTTAFLALSLAVLMTAAAAAAAAAAGSFSVELIHRDSPKSPLYNPAATSVDRARAAARRSASYHAHRFSASTSDDVVSTVVSDRGEYLMEFRLGTPAHKIMAIADTGSDLIWTNCKPCSQCFEQVQPLFDPRNSTTFSPLSCQSQACEALPIQGCGSKSACQYHYSYGDNSNVDGVLATETFTFGSAGAQATKVSKIAFGCNSQSSGTFSNSTGGLVGLGAGPVSLVSQLSPSLDSNYFSYCLVPIMDDQSSSKLVFGSAGKIDSSSKVTTPMSIDQAFYVLSLEEISVEGGGSVSVPSSSSQLSGGNIIIDSGTTLTMLLDDVVSSLVEQVSKVVDLPQVSDPEGLFQLCFQVSQESDQQKLPPLTFKFAGDDASVQLSPLNMFLAVEEQVVCLAVAATTADVGVQIIGNVAQQNLHVGYDLDAKELSLVSTDCTIAKL
ncbi:aspartic proteinase CDR1-like [Curcuma longa]|uniref:aspartic proteinase CDR1-like n=1 Tax=Curcuma longa TaxID=136217 RepID=UPI003D9F2FF0